MEESVALSGERRATFETVGTGRAMLMFVGGPGLPAAMMRKDAELLADSFTVYLIDPHGSGGSTPPADAGDYDHLGHARFYDEVREALGLDEVVVHGVSFGGVVALTYATDDPAEVDEMLRTALPLYCAYPDRPDVRARLEELKAVIRCDLAAGKAWEGGLYQTIDIRPLLERVRCPTLIVTGELDLICGAAPAEPIAAGVSGSTLQVIAECGHWPAVEQPEAYRHIMGDWCSGNL